MKLASTLLASLVAVASAAPSPITTGNSVVHEKRDLQTNSRWVKRDALHSQTRLPVRIALKQRNLDKGMDYLLEVSDPQSVSYGKHYTPEEVVERFAPSDESVETVKRWLIASGIPESSIKVPKSKGWISFESTTGMVESVLQTRYHVYEHARSDEEHIGVDHYTLPDHVSEVVDFILPGIAPLRKPKSRFIHERLGATTAISRPNKFKAIDNTVLDTYKADPESTAVCSTIMTPQCIKKMYGIPNATLANKDNFLGIYEADDEVYAQKDLNDFFTLTQVGIPNGTHPVGNLIGNVTASGAVKDAGGEATLDYEMAYPIVYPQTIVDYQTQTYNNSLFDTFLDAIDGGFCTYSAYGQTGDDPAVDGDTTGHLCGAYKPANVISISYGLAESDYPINYQKRQCDEYMKLGLQGTTIFLASGDYGVAEEPCLGPNQDIFVADSASACPYMTAVGATVLPPGSKPGDEEAAVDSFASGGGFSNIYPQPSYQRHAINRYFISHDPGFKNYSTTDGVVPSTGGIYNGVGRGYPDISAVGDNGLVIVAGKTGRSGGTSMSAPIVASMFNLINEQRLQAGKPTVGFVNPTLYAYEEMFNDIVHGDMASNYSGQGQQGLCNGKGFSAVRGWDPVTGMGTPKFPKMLEIFLSL